MDETKKQLDGALFVEEDEHEAPDALHLDDDDDGDYDPDDGRAEKAEALLNEIFEQMDFEVSVALRENAARVVLDVQGEDAGRAIGKKGATLDALQFLVNKVVNRFPEDRRHVVLDSGDYRERHDTGLVTRAKREAKRAVQQGQVVTLEPMSPRDRRVIHHSLARFPGVTTRSEGEGFERRLKIVPAKQRRRTGVDRRR